MTPVMIGMDLGDKKIQICVLDHRGRKVREATVSNTPAALRKYFQRYRYRVGASENITLSEALERPSISNTTLRSRSSATWLLSWVFNTAPYSPWVMSKRILSAEACHIAARPLSLAVRHRASRSWITGQPRWVSSKTPNCEYRWSSLQQAS